MTTRRSPLIKAALVLFALYAIYAGIAAALSSTDVFAAWSGSYRDPRRSHEVNRVELDLSADGRYTARTACLPGTDILSRNEQTGRASLRNGRLRLSGLSEASLACGLPAELHTLRWNGRAYLASDADLLRLVNHMNYSGFDAAQMEGLLRRGGVPLPSFRSTPPALPRPFSDRLLPRPLQGRVLSVLDTRAEPVWGWMRSGVEGFDYTRDVEIDLGSRHGAFEGMWLWLGQPRGARLTLVEIGTTRSRARFTHREAATQEQAARWSEAPAVEPVPPPLPENRLPQAGTLVRSRPPEQG